MDALVGFARRCSDSQTSAAVLQAGRAVGAMRAAHKLLDVCGYSHMFHLLSLLKCTQTDQPPPEALVCAYIEDSCSDRVWIEDQAVQDFVKWISTSILSILGLSATELQEDDAATALQELIASGLAVKEKSLLSGKVLIRVCTSAADSTSGHESVPHATTDVTSDRLQKHWRNFILTVANVCGTPSIAKFAITRVASWANQRSCADIVPGILPPLVRYLTSLRPGSTFRSGLRAVLQAATSAAWSAGAPALDDVVEVCQAQLEAFQVTFSFAVRTVSLRCVIVMQHTHPHKHARGGTTVLRPRGVLALVVAQQHNTHRTFCACCAGLCLQHNAVLLHKLISIVDGPALAEVPALVARRLSSVQQRWQALAEAHPERNDFAAQIVCKSLHAVSASLEREAPDGTATTLQACTAALLVIEYFEVVGEIDDASETGVADHNYGATAQFLVAFLLASPPSDTGDGLNAGMVVSACLGETLVSLTAFSQLLWSGILSCERLFRVPDEEASREGKPDEQQAPVAAILRTEASARCLRRLLEAASVLHVTLMLGLVGRKMWHMLHEMRQQAVQQSRVAAAGARRKSSTILQLGGAARRNAPKRPRPTGPQEVSGTNGGEDHASEGQAKRQKQGVPETPPTAGGGVEPSSGPTALSSMLSVQGLSEIARELMQNGIAVALLCLVEGRIKTNRAHVSPVSATIQLIMFGARDTLDLEPELQLHNKVIEPERWTFATRHRNRSNRFQIQSQWFAFTDRAAQASSIREAVMHACRHGTHAARLYVLHLFRDSFKTLQEGQQQRVLLAGIRRTLHGLAMGDSEAAASSSWAKERQPNSVTKVATDLQNEFTEAFKLQRNVFAVPTGELCAALWVALWRTRHRVKECEDERLHLLGRQLGQVSFLYQSVIWQLFLLYPQLVGESQWLHNDHFAAFATMCITNTSWAYSKTLAGFRKPSTDTDMEDQDEVDSEAGDEDTALVEPLVAKFLALAQEYKLGARLRACVQPNFVLDLVDASGRLAASAVSSSALLESQQSTPFWLAEAVVRDASILAGLPHSMLAVLLPQCIDLLKDTVTGSGSAADDEHVEAVLKDWIFQDQTEQPDAQDETSSASQEALAHQFAQAVLNCIAARVKAGADSHWEIVKLALVYSSSVSIRSVMTGWSMVAELVACDEAHRPRPPLRAMFDHHVTEVSLRHCVSLVQRLVSQAPQHINETAFAIAHAIVALAEPADVSAAALSALSPALPLVDSVVKLFATLCQLPLRDDSLTSTTPPALAHAAVAIPLATATCAKQLAFDTFRTAPWSLSIAWLLLHVQAVHPFMFRRLRLELEAEYEPARAPTASSPTLTLLAALAETAATIASSPDQFVLEGSSTMALLQRVLHCFVLLSQHVQQKYWEQFIGAIQQAFRVLDQTQLDGVLQAVDTAVVQDCQVSEAGVLRAIWPDMQLAASDSMAAESSPPARNAAAYFIRCSARRLRPRHRMHASVGRGGACKPGYGGLWACSHTLPPIAAGHTALAYSVAERAAFDRCIAFALASDPAESKAAPTEAVTTPVDFPFASSGFDPLSAAIMFALKDPASCAPYLVSLFAALPSLEMTIDDWEAWQRQGGGGVVPGSSCSGLYRPMLVAFINQGCLRPISLAIGLCDAWLGAAAAHQVASDTVQQVVLGLLRRLWPLVQSAASAKRMNELVTIVAAVYHIFAAAALACPTAFVAWVSEGPSSRLAILRCVLCQAHSAHHGGRYRDEDGNADHDVCDLSSQVSG